MIGAVAPPETPTFEFEVVLELFEFVVVTIVIYYRSRNTTAYRTVQKSQTTTGLARVSSPPHESKFSILSQRTD